MAVQKSSFIAVSSMTGSGVLPLGSIHKVLPAISGSAFQPPAPGIIQDGWMVCQGTLGERTVASGIIAGAILPDLSDGRFLQGSTVSWSNANDANPAYKGGSSTTISFGYAGTGTANTTWFAPGNYVPAGTTGPQPVVVPFAHTHPFPAHGHPVGTLHTRLAFLPSGRMGMSRVTADPSLGSTTANFVNYHGDGPWLPVSVPVPATRSAPTGIGGGVDVLGTLGTSTSTSASGGVTFSASHSHPATTGTPTNIATALAAPGNFVPTGTVTGTTTQKPNYMSSIFLVRVG